MNPVAPVTNTRISFSFDSRTDPISHAPLTPAATNWYNGDCLRLIYYRRKSPFVKCNSATNPMKIEKTSTNTEKPSSSRKPRSDGQRNRELIIQIAKEAFTQNGPGCEPR